MNSRELKLYKGQPVQLVKKRGLGIQQPTVLHGIISEVRDKEILFKESDGITRKISIDKISNVRMG